MALNPKKLEVAFIGCGGTYWTAANYLCSVVKRLGPAHIAYVDPDKLTEQNTERQWCVGNHGEFDFDYKCLLAHGLFTPEELLGGAEWLSMSVQEWLAPGGHLEDLLLIVNVDNDRARLDMHEWCSQRREGRTIMVMSGCDMKYGQVYYGVWENGRPIHDWRPLHLEVGNPDHKPVQQEGNNRGCGAQSTMSNFVTGSLFAPALTEALKFWDPDQPDPQDIGEWYWRTSDKGFKVWEQRVARCVPEPEEVL
jgi:hypothetical protein